MLKNWCLTFLDKEKYMLHYESLQLSKKHQRVLEFNQSQWLNPNVEFNAQKRIEAKKKIMAKMKKDYTN